MGMLLSRPTNLCKEDNQQMEITSKSAASFEEKVEEKVETKPTETKKKTTKK